MAASSTLRNPDNPVAILLAKYTQLIRTRLKLNPQKARVTATLILLFSLTIGGYGGRKWLQRRTEEKNRGQWLLRRNSGLRGSDGSRTIFVPYRTSTAKVTIIPTKSTTFDAHRRLFLSPPRPARLTNGQMPPLIPPPQTKPGLNLAFLHQLLSLLSIMIPHWNSKESFLLVSQAAFLMLRTYISLVVARLDGEIVRDLVAGHGKAFLWGIVKWCGIGGISVKSPFIFPSQAKLCRLCFLYKCCHQVSTK